MYAIFMDEADTELGAENAFSCIGYEIVKDYNGASTGETPAGC